MADIHLSVASIVDGAGTRLFKHTDTKPICLALVRSVAGIRVTHLHYQFDR